jgi:hypothetical protein
MRSARIQACTVRHPAGARNVCSYGFSSVVRRRARHRGSENPQPARQKIPLDIAMYLRRVTYAIELIPRDEGDREP